LSFYLQQGISLPVERGPHHPASSISLFFQTEDPFPNAYLLGFVKTLWCHIVSEYLLGCFANGEWIGAGISTNMNLCSGALLLPLLIFVCPPTKFRRGSCPIFPHFQKEV